MWLLKSPFLFARLCSVSLVRFLPVSPMYEVWQSEQLILYTAPCLFLFSSLSLTLVSNWRSVVIGLWATRILNVCRMRKMFSDMPFMYGMVAYSISENISRILQPFNDNNNQPKDNFRIIFTAIPTIPITSYFFSNFWKDKPFKWIERNFQYPPSVVSGSLSNPLHQQVTSLLSK